MARNVNADRWKRAQTADDCRGVKSFHSTPPAWSLQVDISTLSKYQQPLLINISLALYSRTKEHLIEIDR